MFSKKSQGISIHVLIVAAVALVVLIVLIAIFTGKINVFSKTYGETTEEAAGRVCSAQGGRCITAANCGTTQIINAPAAGWIDCTDNQVCCS